MVGEVDSIRPRIIEPLVEESLKTSAVVIIEGGRAVGKSTLCDRLIALHVWQPRLDLSDPNILDTLRLDPLRFLRAQPTPCIIDEAQIEPEVTVWVKRIVDERRMPGQFILTGSTRLGRHQLGGTDPLAGRAIRLRMHSLTQAELDSRQADVIDRAFGNGWSVSDLASDADPPPEPWLGGLPGISGVLDRELGPLWERQIAAYIEAVLPLGAAGTRADLGQLMRTFRYLAANSGQLLNLARAGNDLGMQAATIRRQLDTLEASFLLIRIEAHRPAEHRVVTAHPRVIAADPGLATWASRAWESIRSAALVGSLTETVVAHDLIASADAHPQRIVVRHWRDNRNQRETDLLLVHPDGRLVPIEVKASSTVGPADCGGLRAFADAAGKNCPRAIVVYEGSRVIDLTPAQSATQFVAIPRRLI